MIDTRQMVVIDKLDPKQNSFTMENLERFLSPEDKFNQENDLDYMICDDFFSSFSGQTSEDTESLLKGCLAEADALSKSG